MTGYSVKETNSKNTNGKKKAFETAQP